jgi:hypothetical protein
MFTIFVMGTRRVILAAGFLAGGVMLAGSVSGSAPDKLSAYAYEDTRRLVALVEQAAKLMEEQGENAFSEFGRKGSKCLILCEKINDAEWSRPDIRRIGDGLMADAIAVTASGVFGGVASDTSASNVALSTATGATSRWIGFAAGGLFILLGFSPKLSAVLSIMPTPVMGAIIVFVASFMIISGLQSF